MTTLAAIPYLPGFQIDDFMAGLATRLKLRGLRLGGVVQHNDESCGEGCLSMALEDLSSGVRFPISQDLGSGADGCRLDAAGLAAAGGALATALAGEADLVIVNKFGRQEMLGQGLRQEIAATLMAGLPLLIAVRRDFLPAWREFAGEEWVELPAEAHAIEAWALERVHLAA
jgi:nucleoside-triphosphatase THEP1